jgi:uncharacterized protein (TIGR03437 family)
VAVNNSGNLFITDTGNSRIRKVTSMGFISTIVGSGTYGGWDCYGEARCADLTAPTSVALDRDSNVYFADRDNDRVRRVTPDGRISTVAGTGFAGSQMFSGDGGPALQAHLNKLEGVALDAGGNLYIADTWNQRVRKVSRSGTIDTMAGSGPAGMRNGAYGGDGGPATSARLNYPRGVAVDSAGNLYIADTSNSRIRVVTSQGQISTLIGVSDSSAFGDNRSPLRIRWPQAVAVDSEGNLFVADTDNHRVLKLIAIRGADLATAPQIAPDAVLNAASFSNQIAPGSIVSIFGINFARRAVSATTVPLPRSLGDTSLLVNGTAAPLFLVSPGQINAQIPFEIAPGTAVATLSVASGGVSFHQVAFLVSPAAPGIFQFADGRAVVVNQDGTLNSSDNPARVGSVITAYLTGQGYVDTPVTTGAGASRFLLSRPVLPARASIEDRSAELLFLGLTPGSVGLAQANLRIPTVNPGLRALTITIGNWTSKSASVTVSAN